MKKYNNGYIATKAEHITYNLFWLGQNLLWGYAGHLATYLNIGLHIDELKAAAILLAPQIWDAINDTLFGYIVDKFQWKNGQQFMPWIKIGTFGIGVVTIAMFSIPPETSETLKITLLIISYIFFDALYTFLDAPAFAMSTVMTDNIQERTAFIAGNKLFAMLGGVIASVFAIKTVDSLGWSLGAFIFCGLGCLLMIPYLLCGKERRKQTEDDKEEQFTFKQMFNYMKANKYLIVCLIAFVVFGMTTFEAVMSSYVSCACFGDMGKQLYLAAAAALSVIAVSAVLPSLTKKYDKFYLLIANLIFSIIITIVALIIGYGNFIVAMILIALKCIGLASWQVIIYMLVADTAEYGTYKSGTRATGITFSLQTFTSKLKNAVLNSFMLVCISLTGYVAEATEQTVEVGHKIWTVFLTVPAIGYVVAIAILLAFYKLRDKDVQIMAKYNNGEEITDEEKSDLISKFGPAGK